MFKNLFAKEYKERQPRGNRSLITLSGGEYINEDSAMKVSAYYSGIIYISTQIAKLPWQVKDKDNNIQYGNKINRLINLAPNPEMSAFMFRLTMIQNAIHTGNFYAEIERDRLGRPVALWPMWTRDVEPIRADSDNRLIYRVLGGGKFGRDTILEKEDVFHVRNFHTKDGIVGQGLVDYGSEALGISRGADKFANSLFANGGIPSGVLRTDGKLSEDAIARLKESWASKYGGRKTGDTAILEEGLTYESISHDPNVLQFLESRKFGVIEIARFLRVPPTKLFDIEAATFNNVENANLEVATDTLDAWARNLEGEADIKLLTNQFAGNKTEFDMYAIFRGDAETRGKYFKDRMQTGSITPNEIRKAEGDSPYEGGDKFYIATNNYTPQDRVDDVIDSQINKGEPKEETEDEKEVNKALAKYLSR